MNTRGKENQNQNQNQNQSKDAVEIVIKNVRSEK